ncbi:MAG: hypothetical protein OZ929_24010, partial [Bryobacterales bacterium]|nr:hypothetical protein [Bryobacterales bacterium]
ERFLPPACVAGQLPALTPRLGQLGVGMIGIQALLDGAAGQKLSRGSTRSFNHFSVVHPGKDLQEFTQNSPAVIAKSFAINVLSVLRSGIPAMSFEGRDSPVSHDRSGTAKRCMQRTKKARTPYYQ